MVDEAGDFMSLMGSTSKPCASGGRGFSFQSDAIRANAAERFRAARIAFLRKYPFRAMRERNLAPPVGGAFSCRTLGTLGDDLTWRYAQTLFIRFSLAPASRRGFSCARHAAGRPLLFPFCGGRLCDPFVGGARRSTSGGPLFVMSDRNSQLITICMLIGALAIIGLALTGTLQMRVSQSPVAVLTR